MAGLFPVVHSGGSPGSCLPVQLFSLHTGPHLPHGEVGHFGPDHTQASPNTHRDGEIVPHVLPYDAVSYGLAAPATHPWLVPVQVPPSCIQDAEEPESGEQEAYEDYNADLSWRGKQERGLRGRKCPGPAARPHPARPWGEDQLSMPSKRTDAASSVSPWSMYFNLHGPNSKTQPPPPPRHQAAYPPPPSLPPVKYS